MMWRYCPHCGGPLPASAATPARPDATLPAVPVCAPGIYDQSKHWRALVAQAESMADPPSTDALVERIMSGQPPASSGLPLSSIVHLVLDREITPSGGVLMQSVLSDGRQGPASDLDRLRRLGYVIENGRVKLVDGIPVGRAFTALQYWGGERQHKRWHLQEPIQLNPSRHGDPFFMDERYVAFGAVWRDLEHFADAMTGLIEKLRQGFDGVPIASPLVVDVMWRGTVSAQE